MSDTIPKIENTDENWDENGPLGKDARYVRVVPETDAMRTFTETMRKRLDALKERDANLNIGPPIQFALQGYELHLYEEWRKQHHQPGVCSLFNTQTAIGGDETISFTPTSIGVAVCVKCACGTEKNLTDYASW